MTLLVKCSEGIKLFEEALEVYDNLTYITNGKIYVRLLYNLAKSYYLENIFEDSFIYCHKGIEYCLESETIYLLGELFYQQGLTYMKMGVLEEALVSLHRTRALFDIQSKTAEYIENTDEYIKKIEEIMDKK